MLVADHGLPQLQFQARLEAGDRAGDGQVQAANATLAVTPSAARHRNRQNLIALISHWLWQPCVLSPEQQNIPLLKAETLQGKAISTAAADHAGGFGETVFERFEVCMNREVHMGPVVQPGSFELSVIDREAQGLNQ